jgi:hypothetical protein
MAGAGAALGGALGAIQGGPAKIEHTGEGFPFKALIMGGLGVVKSNLVPSAIVSAPHGIAAVVGGVLTVMGFLGITAMMGLIGSIAGLVALVGALSSLVFVPNYYQGVAEYQRSGTNLSIGTLLDFSKVVRNLIALLVGCVGFMPFGILGFALHIMLEKETATPANALKAALAFGKANLVPMILLSVVLGLLVVIPAIIPVLGGFTMIITMPVAMVAHYLAYDLKRTEIETLAATEGIAL